MAIKAIWRGAACSLESRDEQKVFNINVGGEVIYSGVSVGEDTGQSGSSRYHHEITAQSILAPYLIHQFPLDKMEKVNGVWRYKQSNSSRRYSIQAYNTLAESRAKTYVPDWSGEEIDYDYMSSHMDDTAVRYFERLYDAVIDPLLDDRQYFIHSDPFRISNSNEPQATLVDQEGESHSVISGTYDFCDAFKYLPSVAADGWEIRHRCILPGHASFKNFLVQPIKRTCGRYVLHFVNAFGRWDSLVIQGNSKESLATTRDSYTQVRRANELLLPGWLAPNYPDRGIVDYNVSVQRKWELHTHYLTDKQSDNMRHLLGSPNVYLYDMEKMIFYPVVLKAEETAIQTYKNNGHQLVSYTINVESAQAEQR